jgi:shikimate kinase
MGAGKSAVGRALAELLEAPFHDLDQLVEETAGMSVAEIFAAEGEAGFRVLEREALEEVCVVESGVVALGGGTVIETANRQLIRQAGHLVWLNTARSTMLDRLAAAVGDRPLFESREQAARLFDSRLDQYRDCDIELRPRPQETITEIASRIAAQAEVV